MTGAMSAAIAAMKAHMDKLNVIGNNVANVNTYGFKSSRVLFQDSLYTTLKTGSNGTATVGGRNPSQIGYGASISSIDLDMSSGSYMPTGRGLDTMISGDGFFLVGDKTTGTNIDPNDPETLKSLTLTRVGDFTFGPDGYLVDGRGNVVYGFMMAADDPDDPDAGEHLCDQLVPIRYPGVDQDGNIMWPITDDGNGGFGLTDAKDNGDTWPKAQIDGVSIDESTGKVTATIKGSDEPVTIGYLAIGNVTNPAGVSHTNGSYYKAQEGAGDLTISSLGNAVAGEGVYYINSSIGDGNNQNTAGTYPINMEVRGAGTTSLLTGGLEGSKTDLATEISEMITTQRGYQANTRIITVTDTMLEELVNIKR